MAQSTDHTTVREHVESTLGIPWAEWAAMSAAQRVAAELAHRGDTRTPTLPPFVR